MQPLVSQTSAIFCTLLSLFGVVFLVVLGYLFASGSEQFTESINSPPDPQGVAHSCYIAALVYAGCFCFCGLQLVLHKRVADRHTYVALPRH